MSEALVAIPGDTEAGLLPVRLHSGMIITG